MRITICKVSISLVLCLGTTMLRGEQCGLLDSGKQQDIVQYIQKRYSFSPQAQVTVTGEEFVRGTCYRKFTFQSTSPKRIFSMYLSPDQKYLSPILMDLTMDPEEEALAIKEETEAELVADKAPTRGDNDALVTIVEFSDFQCPFCKRFTDLFDNLPDLEKRKVRLIYKELPLSMHPWAKRAATIAICAGKQGDDAFWRVHDFFFANQGTIKPDNIDSRFSDFLEHANNIDASQIKTCTDTKAAEIVLARDAILASKFGVRGTPTLFVNGQPTQGIKSVEELSNLIEHASAIAKHNMVARTAQTANTPK